MKQTCSDLEEIWRDIVGYEGLYEDSNMGRVKSLNYRRTGTERVLRAKKNRNGYLYVDLYKDGKVKKNYIHRLVAQSFLDNPHNLPEVNHINEVVTDNRAKNLEWCDRKYNCNYGTAIERRVVKISKPVLQLTLEGKLVREWSSTHEAERLGGFNQRHISSCCLGKLNTHGGYRWKYKKEIA